MAFHPDVKVELFSDPFPTVDTLGAGGKFPYLHYPEPTPGINKPIGLLPGVISLCTVRYLQRYEPAAESRLGWAGLSGEKSQRPWLEASPQHSADLP